LALLGSCSLVRSNDWNLQQLHDEESRHKYSAALESDVEYFLRHEVTRFLSNSGMQFAQKSPSQVEDPASECLDNLVELARFDGSDPETSAIQVEWFSRIALEDPWKLSRERAVIALGRTGRLIRAGLPVKLPESPPAAGAPEVSAALTALAQTAEVARANDSSTTHLDLEAACQVLRDMVLDVAGARRALRVASELSDASGVRDADAKLLTHLSYELQRRCARQSLAAALLDTEPLVRAAAVEASVDCAGLSALDPMLAQLRREPAPEVVIRVMHLVRDRGLPEIPADVPPDAALKIRRTWMSNIYSLLSDRPEGPIRIAAMQALAKVSGTPLTSLREEDWQSWWLSMSTGPALSEPAKREVQPLEPAGTSGPAP
jgi:hypothetical protein